MSHNRKPLRIERAGAMSFVKIRTGADGSIDVANQCGKLIRDINFYDTAFEKFAADVIYLNNNLTSYSPLTDRLQAIYSYVQNKVAYISDVKALESIKDARQTLSDGFGDCDDQSVLTGTLMSVLGITPTLVLARIRKTKIDANGKEIEYKTPDYNHIYNVHIIGDRVYYMDTVLQTKDFNGKADTIIEEKYIPVFTGNASDVAGMNDIFSKTKHIAKETIKTLIPVASFLPIPFSGSIASWVGENILGVTPDSLSSVTTRINTNLDSLIAQVKGNKLNYEQAVKQGGIMVSEFYALIKNITNANLQKNAKIYYASVKNKYQILKNTVPSDTSLAVWAR